MSVFLVSEFRSMQLDCPNGSSVRSRRSTVVRAIAGSDFGFRLVGSLRVCDMSETSTIAVEDCTTGIPVRYFPVGEIDGELYRLAGYAYERKGVWLVNLAKYAGKSRRVVLRSVPVSRCYEFPTPEDIRLGCAEIQDRLTDDGLRRRHNLARGLDSGHDDSVVTIPTATSNKSGRQLRQVWTS